MKITLVDGDLTNDFFMKCLDCLHIGVDTETSGVDRKKDSLACVQVFAEHRDEPECMIVRRFNDEPSNLMKLLSNSRNLKIFHHAPFDLEFMMRDFKGLRPRACACTKLMAKIIDPHRTKFYDPNKERAGHTLAALVYTLCGVKLDKKLAVSNWFASELSSEQVAYAVNDIRYLPTIYRDLIDAMTPDQIEDYIGAIQALPVKIKMELDYGKTDLYGYE